jgi:hypothetical protein
MYNLIKPRRLRWTGHVTRIGRRGMHMGFWWESLKEILPGKKNNKLILER